jgi:antitoxin CcdA
VRTSAAPASFDGICFRPSNAHIMRIERCAMKSDYDATARKRPVNLTLNEDLVNQVKGLTDNLSQVVETLLSGYVSRAKDERVAKSQAVESAVNMWNDFNAKSGSIADEYSSL